MSNPFEDEDAMYLVLANHERQHSLWPATIAVPAGWEQVHGEDSRAACLDYIERNWTDIRPASLVAAMADGQPHDPVAETQIDENRPKPLQPYPAAVAATLIGVTSTVKS